MTTGIIQKILRRQTHQLGKDFLTNIKDQISGNDCSKIATQKQTYTAEKDQQDHQKREDRRKTLITSLNRFNNIFQQLGNGDFCCSIDGKTQDNQ